jgi:hypothetical protein
MLTVGELGIGRRLVTDFEPFELDDADVFTAAFPNLALAQFHGNACLSRAVTTGEAAWSYFFFFLAAFFLGAGFLALVAIIFGFLFD